jgi:hypothetical protein
MLSAQPKGDSINLNDSKAIVDFSSMNSLEKYRYQKDYNLKTRQNRNLGLYKY